MKKSIPILICSLLLFSCTKHIKTYYPDGKLESEYSVDHDGKKDGLCKVYNKDGKWYWQMEMIHDTMSGVMKYYNTKSGKLWKIDKFERGIYNVSITDSEFIRSISHHTFVEGNAYNDSGNISFYGYATPVGDNQTTGIGIKYKNDTISYIMGIPMITMYRHTNEKYKNLKIVEVRNIPKCSRNFYIINSTDDIIDSCVGCDNTSLKVDSNQSYALKIEYVDSLLHIKHSIYEPLIQLDKKKFPKGNNFLWRRE